MMTERLIIGVEPDDECPAYEIVAAVLSVARPAHTYELSTDGGRLFVDFDAAFPPHPLFAIERALIAADIVHDIDGEGLL
jgi:hypothetical protein